MTSTVLQSFFKIGATLNHREGEILYMFEEITFFKRYYGNIKSPKGICH